jgi:hypothetical protein
VPRASLDVALQLTKMGEGLKLLPERPDAIVLDVETDADRGAATVTKCLRDHVWHLRQWYTGKLVLYTNLNYLQNYITDIFGLDLWIAWPNMVANNPPVNSWVIWQRSFSQPIPGVPDPTTDYDEFNGDEAALYQYFGVPAPEPEPIPEPEPEEEMDLAKIRELLGGIGGSFARMNAHLTLIANECDNVDYLLQELVANLEGEPGPEPPPPPPPPPPPSPATVTYTVMADKAIAHYVDDMNAAGKPIMAMIPVEERTGQPFKNERGQMVKVLPTPVDADGSIHFYQIYGVTRRGTGAALYLPADKGAIS